MLAPKVCEAAQACTQKDAKLRRLALAHISRSPSCGVRYSRCCIVGRSALHLSAPNPAAGATTAALSLLPPPPLAAQRPAHACEPAVPAAPAAPSSASGRALPREVPGGWRQMRPTVRHPQVPSGTPAQRLPQHLLDLPVKGHRVDSQQAIKPQQACCAPLRCMAALLHCHTAAQRPAARHARTKQLS